MLKEVYNCKIYRYADKDQVRIYRKGVVCADDVTVDRDGVITKKVHVESQELNPFTNEFEHMREWSEESEERSQRVSMNRTINKVYELSRSNHWEYFFTMTFDGSKVNRYDYDECVKRLSKWLNNMRNMYSPDMVYLVVPERHKDGAYHFHGLFRNIGSMPLTDSGIVKNGRKIYNLPTYKFGFTTVSEVGSSGKASNYVCKYITKELCQVTKGKKRYWCSRNITRPVSATLTIEGEMADKIDIFRGHIDHMKSLEGIYQSVTYIELDCRIDDIEYFRSNLEVGNE